MEDCAQMTLAGPSEQLLRADVLRMVVQQGGAAAIGDTTEDVLARARAYMDFIMKG